MKKAKRFGPEISQSSLWFRPNVQTIVYVALLVLAFCFFSLYSGVTKMVFSEDKVDLFTKDLPQIALYFTPVDRELSQKLLVLDQIVQSYMSGDNVFQTKRAQIDDVRDYVIQHKDYLQSVGFDNYQAIMELFTQLYNYREEVYNLLGSNQPFHYLILLQNGNEKRPNGGFFGSFAYVTFDGGHIKDLQIIDSYLPDFVAPNVRLQSPRRFADAFGVKDISLIAGNKFGFTDMDGKNIKTLFERMVGPESDPTRIQKMFNTKDRNMIQNNYIKGVIFLNSNLIKSFFPGFEKNMQERQFVNASIDLIRGETVSNKKELYIQQVNDYFQANKFTILRNLVNSRAEIPASNYLQFYFSNVSTGFNDFLVKNNLTNIYSHNKIYARDANAAQNKSDEFITKHITITDDSGNILLFTDKDILDISSFKNPSFAGKTYHLKIEYDFIIQPSYVDFIHSLEKKYDIELTEREKHILVIKPILYDGAAEMNWRATRGMVYFPLNTEIIKIQGDHSMAGEFLSDFAKGVQYYLRTDQSSASLSEEITFMIN